MVLVQQNKGNAVGIQQAGSYPCARLGHLIQSTDNNSDMSIDCSCHRPLMFESQEI